MPVSRIFAAVQRAVTILCCISKSVEGSDVVFIINLKDQDTKMRSWKGGPRISLCESLF